MNSFECQTCCDTYDLTRKLNKKITCIQCDYTTCNHCQKTYEKAECMNCHTGFTKTQIETLLGKTFVKNVIIKRIVDNLLLEEKKLIPDTFGLIKYNEEVARRKKLLRVGKQVFEDLPPIPIIVAKTSVEPCSKSGCKGYLHLSNTNTDGIQHLTGYNYECMMCKLKHCYRCHVAIDESADEHVCNKATLETIAQLERDTRRCPKCYTRIFKIMGCDHMCCTSCGSHFSWNTGVLLKGSSNHHYDNAIRNNAGNTEGICLNTFQDPSIPQDILSKRLSERMIYDLYTYPNKIRHHYRTNCNYDTILQARIDANNELRIRFIQNDIEERTWGQRLYMSYKTMKLKIAHREIIEIYLSGIDAILSKIHNSSSLDETQVHEEIVELVEQCNVCFESANDEFYCETTESRFVLAVPNMNDNTVVLEQKIIKNRPASAKKAKPAVEPAPKREVQLFEYQLEHFTRIHDMLEEHRIAFDLSPMGAGKTYITCKYLQLHPCENMFIICPPMLKAKWIRVAAEYGINITVLTYNEFGGTKMKQPTHNLLRRDDLIVTQNLRDAMPFENNTRDIELVRYYPTELLKDMVSKPNGIFVAFDEIQCIRNETSNTTRACRVIMNEIFNARQNRMLCISGTPFDKEQQFVTMFRNIGIQESPELFKMNMATWQNEATGFNEIMRYCERLARGDVQYALIANINRRPPWRTAQAYKVLFELFLTIIKPNLTSAITMPDRQATATLNASNVFYDLQGEDRVLCDKSIQSLLEIVDSNNAIVGQTRIQLFKSLVILESSKINTFADEVRHVLSTNPNAKVVVALSYTESLNELAEKLMEWSPLIINGEITRKNKELYIAEFQQPNTNKRLLIGNVNVISTGIDLDDKDGNFPRYVFVNPNFSIITLQQLSYRFLRSLDTKSHTTIRYVYSSTGLPEMEGNPTERYVEMDRNAEIRRAQGARSAEMRIINALIKKSTIIKSVSDDNMQMPDTYKSYRRIIRV